MAKSYTEGFSDALARIMQEISRAKITPDADLVFLGEMEGLIIERFQNPNLAPMGVSAAGTQPNFSAQAIGGGQMGGPPMGGMGEMSMAPGRLPPGGPAPGGEVEELRRVLAGS